MVHQFAQPRQHFAREQPDSILGCPPDAALDIGGLSFRGAAQDRAAILERLPAAKVPLPPALLPAGGERESAPLTEYSARNPCHGIAAAFPLPVYGERDRVRGKTGPSPIDPGCRTSGPSGMTFRG